MVIRVINADERLSTANNKTSFAIFGPPGVGKTSLLRTLPADQAICIDLEAGLKSVQAWRGPVIPIRNFKDFQALCVLLGGPDPAASSGAWYSQQHYEAVCQAYASTELGSILQSRPIVFVDSITDLTRQAMSYAQTQPEAFSEKTGTPDIRGAYGLLAREVIHALKHLQHAPGKTVILVGVLEQVIDDFKRPIWQPQMEGAKAGRELPGIVDQVMSMQYFARDVNGEYSLDEKASERRLVCQSGNPWGLPAKDRSGNLDLLEPPNLSRLLSKINQTANQ